MAKKWFKRLFSILLSLLLLLGLVPIYEVSAENNLSLEILNPGFEMDLVEGNIPGWSRDEATVGLIELNSAAAKNGKNSLHFHDTDDNPSSPGLRVLSDKIAVTPGAEYTVSASVYVVQQTHSIMHEFQYFDTNDKEIIPRNQYANTSGTLALNAWNEIKMVSTAPANAVYAKIGFYSGKQSLTNAYFDDVSLIEKSTAPAAPGPVQNLGFEMDLADGKIPGWSLVAGTAGLFEISTDKYRSGSKSLHYKDSSDSTSLQVWSDVMPVAPERKYIAKAFVNVVSQSHSIGYEVHFFDDKGTRVDKATFINFKTDALGTNKWTEIQVPFTVPAGATKIRLLFNSGKPSLTEAYFDDVSVEEDTPVVPEPIYDAIQNPGFELDMVKGAIPNWRLVLGTQLAETSSATVKGGIRSLYFKDSDTATGLRIMSDKIAVVPGEAYIARAYVNVVSQSHNIVYEVYYYDENDVEIKSGYRQEMYGSTGLGINRWSPLNVYSIAPEGARYARVAFYSGNPSSTEAYFDDVSFEKLPGETPLNREYRAPVDLGPMVMVSLGQAGKIQTNALGENEAYFVSNGKPGTFWVVDGETGALKFSEVIPNTISTWAMAIGPDKNVYFSGTEDAKLYRYLPEEKRVELLGNNPSSAWTWDLEASPDGKIYGATYGPNGQAKVYEYDIHTARFRNYGVIKEGQDYVRGIAVHGDYIYAGVGSTYLGLFKINRITGEKEEIIVPGYTGNVGTVADVYIVNNKLLVSVSTMNIVVMDMDTLEVEGSFQQNAMISEPDSSNPNLIYYKYGTKLYNYDLSTNVQAEIPLPVPVPDTGRVKDMKWITLNSGEKAGKTVMAIITQYGEYMLFDPADNWISFVILEIAPQPVNIQSLKTGEMDGRLYMGGYQRGMSVYNPFTNEREVNISSFAQPENIGFLNDYVYYGTYVGAIMYRFDPTKPVNLGDNPKLVYDITHQDRPFAITSGDDKLFVGTVGDYGFLGGALAIYDEPTGTWTQFDNPVADQAIIGLAYKDGYLYGGTTVWGGLGAVPTASEAKIFVWDVANGKKVDEFTPDIPNVDEAPRMIGDLKFGPDGLLWGAVDGTIFAMDVTTREIVKSKMVRPSLYNSSKWKPYQLEFGPDGTLYTTLSRKVIAIDPETLNYKVIDDRFVNDMSVGIDGSIYYAPDAGNNLSRIAVPETDATLSSITLDGEPLAGFSPGKLEYTSELSSETAVAATATQANATVSSEVYNDRKQTVIRVTGTDGKSTLVYKINWSAKAPVDPVDPVEPTDPPGPTEPSKPEVPTSPINKDTQIISKESLQANGQGVISISLEEGKSSVLLPGNSGQLVGDKPLVLSKDEFAVELAPGILNQMQRLAEQGGLKNAQIKFSFDSVEETAEQELIDNAKNDNKATIKAASGIYEFKLSLTGADNKEVTPAKFEEPVTISYKVTSEVHPDLVGIYKIAEDGKLTYAGGAVKDGRIRTEIKSSGKYAVLEFDKTFSDVPAGHWAASTLKVMAARLIAKGVNDTEFAPEQSVTRAEFAALVVRALGLEAKGTGRFADVESGKWYAADIAAAYEAGLVNGVSSTHFAADSKITREQMAVLLLRAYEYQKGIKASGLQEAEFSDKSSISPWAASFINSALELGLVRGRGNNSFVPQGELTRAEAIQAIFNMLER